MKKIIYGLTGVALTAVLMVGCGSTTTTTQSNSASSNTSTNDGSNKQGNFQRPDLEGEVSSIDGNKITLKVIKTPDRSAGADNKNQNSDGGDKSNQNGNNQDQQSPKGQQKRQVEYTGETKDITIGDGVQIKTIGRGNKGSQSNDLTVSDIKVGDRLGITYSDKTNETISNIIVMPVSNKNAKTDAGN